MNEQDLIEEQTAYYRSRAAEYDEWFLRSGRYDRGEEHRRLWNGDLDTVRRQLAEIAPLGSTLEIACGTGLWTSLLVELSDSLVALDSVEETIDLNRKKNSNAEIDYIVVNVFEFDPQVQYNTIFFGFWLSHVPSSHFERFWSTVEKALKPNGRVIFVDSLKAQRSTANDHHMLDDSGVVERRLNSGDTFRIVKRFYEPEQLLETLGRIGWTGEISSTEEFFLFGNVHRTNQGKQ